MSIYEAIDKLFGLIKLILLIRIVLTWFPNINWWNQPFKLLNDITEPLLAPFRRLIPSLGGIDISPIFAFLFLSIMQTVLLTLVMSI